MLTPLRFLLWLCLTLSALAHAQTALPPCQGSHLTSRWDACIGAITYSNGDKLAGEFRNGRLNGQGMEVLASGYQYIGQFKDDLLNKNAPFGRFFVLPTRAPNDRQCTEGQRRGDA